MIHFKRWVPGVVVVALMLALVTVAGAESYGLAGTSWQLVQIEHADGTADRPDDPAKYTLQFHADGALVTRLNCNRGSGTWKSTAPGEIEFGVMAVTMAACLSPSLDTQMARDLASVHSYAIEDGHLHLNVTGDGFYEFAPVSAAGLANTSWKLVEIRNANGTSVHADDPTKVTVAFESDGSVIAQLNCNRGHGTWKSASPGKIELGPLGVTRMMCLKPSLADQMSKDWSNIKSYAIEGDRLRLTLSTGVSYVFEPFIEPSPAPTPK